MKKLLSVPFALLIAVVALNTADARPQYKSIIRDLEATTDAEKDVQTKVGMPSSKGGSCNYCHDKKDKKIRTEYGMTLHKALGGGKTEGYEYVKDFWAKDDDGNYSEAAIKKLVDAINAKPSE